MAKQLTNKQTQALGVLYAKKFVTRSFIKSFERFCEREIDRGYSIDLEQTLEAIEIARQIVIQFGADYILDDFMRANKNAY